MESHGLVTARNALCDWPSRSRPVPSNRLLWATSRRSAVGAPQQQQKKEQSGHRGGNGLKEKKKNRTVTPDEQSLDFYILFLPRRNLKFFYFPKSDASTSVLRILITVCSVYISSLPQVSSLFSSRRTFTAPVPLGLMLMILFHAHHGRDTFCWKKRTNTNTLRRVIEGLRCVFIRLAPQC